MSSEIRQRKNVTKVGASSNGSSEQKERRMANVKQNESTDKSFWYRFSRHPLGISLMCLTLIPILLLGRSASAGFPYFRLKNPEMVNSLLPFFKLRPSMGENDARQVLIVGTMSGGTRQVASDLSEKLGLEVDHELSDAQTYFVRDGSVWWFHAIRYLPKPPAKTIAAFCADATFNIGFHPKFYRSGICPEDIAWSQCWAKECFDILSNDWGCAASNTCQPHFAKVLHQVRNPAFTVESLVAKFCEGGTLPAGKMKDTFVKFSNGMFGQKHNFSEYSCIEGAGHYVVEYHNAMIKARQDGFIDAMFKLEETSTCQVAKLAGFMDESDCLYPPNYVQIQRICSVPENVANTPMKAKRYHKVNKGKIWLNWSDYEGSKHGSTLPKGDKTLVKAIRQLMLDLGYDPDQNRERIERQAPKATAPGIVTGY